MASSPAVPFPPCTVVCQCCHACRGRQYVGRQPADARDDVQGGAGDSADVLLPPRPPRQHDANHQQERRGGAARRVPAHR